MLQEEFFEDRALSRFGLPASLHFMNAIDYLEAPDRARGNAPLPDFGRIAFAGENASSNKKTFAAMKAALLAIEAALPEGCIDRRENGPWRPPVHTQWHYLVSRADGPATLMQCTILLEDTISDYWIKEDVGYIRSCIPARWKAVAEASPSSLAIRIILLDRSIQYGWIDKKRFSKRKKKR